MNPNRREEEDDWPCSPTALIHLNGGPNSHERSGLRSTLSNSRNEYRGAFEAPGAEIPQRLIGLGERVAGRLRNDADRRRQLQEVEPVLPGEIGDRHELPLLPKQAIGKGRNVAHMDARANDSTAFANRLQRQGNEISGRRKDDRGVEGLRRYFVRAAWPFCAEP